MLFNVDSLSVLEEELLEPLDLISLDILTGFLLEIPLWRIHFETQDYPEKKYKKLEMNNFRQIDLHNISGSNLKLKFRHFAGFDL